MTHVYRILAATDFSTGSRRAVARAGQLARQCVSELCVLHACPDWPLYAVFASASQRHYRDLTRSAHEHMQETVTWLKNEYGLTAARGEVHLGRATAVTARMIDAVSPTLLVIGAAAEHGGSGTEGFLGGTALKLISRTRLPTLVVRNPQAAAYRSALIAVPGDVQAAQQILHWVETLMPEGICHLVRAYDAPYADRLQLCGYDEAALAASAEQERQLAQDLCEVLARAARAPNQIRIHCVRGTALPTLQQQIKECAPELVAVGRHTPLSEEHPSVWASGLGARLSYHCPTDVLLIP